MSHALNRIETAIARIEAAAAPGGAQPSAADRAEFENLKEAHEALRGKVQGAIAQLDRLLAPQGSN